MKSLRGSAFLSTILLVLLLLVALSTATFAWFSANNVVNVSSISFVAETREGETQGDLQIGWAPTIEGNNYIISFAQPDDSGLRLKPMMPIEAPVIGATKDIDEFGNNIFSLGFISGIQEAGVYMYDGFVYDDDESITPYRCKGTLSGQESFYIINKNPQFGQKISIDYTIEGELKDKICIAVFIENTLQFVLSKRNEIYYGTIKQGTNVADTPHVDNLVSVSHNNSVIVPANSSAKVTMYAWYNGVIMNDSDVDKSSTLSILKFKGAYISSAR